MFGKDGPLLSSLFSSQFCTTLSSSSSCTWTQRWVSSKARNKPSEKFSQSLLLVERAYKCFHTMLLNMVNVILGR